jgi:hypothetical protein
MLFAMAVIPVFLYGCTAGIGQHNAPPDISASDSAATGMAAVNFYPANTVSPDVQSSPGPEATDNLAILESSLKEAEKEMIPEIEGLYRTKIGEEYTYLALEGNAYSLDAGEHAGVYREEVYCQEFGPDSQGFLSFEDGNFKKIGGVCLSAVVVEKMSLENESSGAANYIPVPIDISHIGLKERVTISADLTFGGSGKNEDWQMGGTKVSFLGTASIVNICHDHVDYFSVVGSNDTRYLVSSLITGNPNWQRELSSADGKRIHNRYSESIYFFSSAWTFDYGVKFITSDYGDKIVTADSDICFSPHNDNGSYLIGEGLMRLAANNGTQPFVFIKANI